MYGKDANSPQQCYPYHVHTTQHKPERSTRGLMVIAASVHGLLWPTCNHNHKLLATGSLLQLLELQKLRDLDLHLGSGQGHTSMHNTCRTTKLPDHVTVFSSSTEIRPFEFREISTVCVVWTIVIAFLEGNSKIGLPQAVDQVPYYHHQPSVLSSKRKW